MASYSIQEILINEISKTRRGRFSVEEQGGIYWIGCSFVWQEKQSCPKKRERDLVAHAPVTRWGARIITGLENNGDPWASPRDERSPWPCFGNDSREATVLNIENGRAWTIIRYRWSWESKFIKAIRNLEIGKISGGGAELLEPLESWSENFGKIFDRANLISSRKRSETMRPVFAKGTSVMSRVRVDNGRRYTGP